MPELTLQAYIEKKDPRDNIDTAAIYVMRQTNAASIAYKVVKGRERFSPDECQQYLLDSGINTEQCYDTMSAYLYDPEAPMIGEC
jgi:hypothetical protein